MNQKVPYHTKPFRRKKKTDNLIQIFYLIKIKTLHMKLHQNLLINRILEPVLSWRLEYCDACIGKIVFALRSDEWLLPNQSK